MDALDLFRAVRRNLVLIVAVTVAGTALSALAAAQMEPEYTSRAQVFVSGAKRSDDVDSAYTGSRLVQERVTSYVAVVTSTTITRRVADDLGLAASPQALSRQLSADNPDGTSLINVTASADDPAQARDVLDATTQEFVRLVDDLEGQTRTDGRPQSVVRVSVIREPTLPDSPAGLSPRMVVAVGYALGLALGVGAALVRTALDTRLHTAGQAERALDRTVLGVVPRFSPLDGSPGTPRLDAATAESFRKIRTALQARLDGPGPHRLLVTSAVAGEGGSTTAYHLAAALADTGRRVVLVETDLRRPTAVDRLRLAESPHLLQVLDGDVAPAQAVQPVRRGLSVIPAPVSGTAPESTEELGSPRMSALLEALDQVADVVVVDAPPTLATADAETVATETGGVVVVARTAATSEDAVRATLRTYDVLEVPVLGVVLTVLPTRHGRWRRALAAGRLRGSRTPGQAPAPQAPADVGADAPEPATHDVRPAWETSAQERR